jgi:glycine C-acetyltransferase
MEGDIAPLEEIVALKDEFKFLLYVDEAHTFGFYGKSGAGLCNELNIANRVDFIMTTLSKSTAGVGGIIATSREFASLLRWASTYIFQASIPPADVAIVDACLDLIQNDSSIICSLWNKTRYLRKKLENLGFDLGQSKSPIVPVYIRDSNILKTMERELYEKGIFTIAIQYPIVKANQGRFRFIVNNSHTFANIDHLVSVFSELGYKHGVIHSAEIIPADSELCVE